MKVHEVPPSTEMADPKPLLYAHSEVSHVPEKDRECGGEHRHARVVGGRTTPFSSDLGSPGCLLYPYFSGYEAKLIILKAKCTLPLRVQRGTMSIMY